MARVKEEAYYRPGLLFLSNAANLQYFIRPAQFWTGPNGEREQSEPAIMAEFGDFSLSPNEFQDSEGIARADIRGGAFDLDEAASHFGWDEDTRETIARKMLRALEDPSFRDFWLYETPIPVPPWPTYEENDVEEIPTVAKAAGLVIPALNYERATLNREELVEKLQALADEDAEQEEYIEE